jgi:hypothetical protein
VANKISVLVDVTVDRANQALGNFRKSVVDADGALGKFKAGAGQAFNAIKENAAQLAVAGGAALVAFGAKAVNEFNDAALAAGRFAEATGISTEEASRWISAADDIGVSAEAVEKAFVKMTVEMGKGNAVFDQYGIEVIKAADGTDDMNATMLNTIDVIGRIPNASERARVAQQLFGRGYAEVAELVMNGSEGVIEALEATSDAQIFDEDEVRKAREYRAAMDNLGDAVTDVTLIVGEGLTPTITSATNALMALREAANVVPGPLRDAFGVIEKAINPVNQFNEIMETGEELFGEAAETVGTLGDSFNETSGDIDRGTNIMSDAEISARRLEASLEDTEDAAAALSAEYQRLRDQLSDREAYRVAQEGLSGLLTQAVETGDVSVAQIDRMKSDLLDYGETLDSEADKRRVAELVTNLDQDSFWATALALKELENTRYVNFVAQTGATQGGQTRRAGSVDGFRAAGGPVSAGGTYVVGEDGPELLQMGSQSGNVIPNGATIGGGGTNITINVTAGMGADGQQIGRQVASALESYYRSGGRRI